MVCGGDVRGRRPLPTSRRPARALPPLPPAPARRYSSPVGCPDELASSLAALRRPPSPPARRAPPLLFLPPTGRACAADPLPPAAARHTLPPVSAPLLEMDGKTLYNELEVVEGMKLDRGSLSLLHYQPKEPEM
ncbi:Os12g0228400 [Oryza sativa Japonica Group]|uniref:Expressed protein n=1 Tax=Oryza sativa subsp. japonica TaxID=39947 RepID=B7ER93_ORYSJ|nr:expressed protein [Oryza sativa Japonica Group]ABG21928.1 expressed protein [Oryza sativa Japonica Group]BAG94890.1 unnamed protein product [Oryza sativa Japonica Group]BAT16416.1 Os12g0228400 [Oryza sativa Japonica Group]